MKKPDFVNLVRFLPLIGFLLLICLYFVIHKPFNQDFVIRAGNNFWILLLAFTLCALAGGTGRWILIRLNFEAPSSLISFALGSGILSLIFFFIGFLVGIYAWWVWIGSIIGIILLFRHIRGWLGDIFTENIDVWHHSTPFGKALGWINLIIIICALIIALAPPIKFDALVYHLALPKGYIFSENLAYRPDNMFWGMPQVGEMLYTWAMVLGGDRTAVCLGWVVGVISLSGLLRFAARRYNASVGWVAISALLSGYTFAASLSWGYVDWFTFLFGLSVLIMLDQWMERGDKIKIILAGAMAGFCLGCKYTAGVIILAALGVILWWQGLKFKRSDTKVNDSSIFISSVQLILIFGITVVCISLPWWVKNYYATGNPFYPFFFPAGAIDAFRLSFYQIPASASIWESVLLPFSATFLGVEGAAGFSASIGPLLLGLGLFAWLPQPLPTKNQKHTTNLCLVMAFSGILVWMVGSRFSEYLIQSRMYFSIFPALAILSGLGFNGFTKLRPFGIRMQNIVGALIILCICFSALEVSTQIVKTRSINYLANLISEDDYLGENLGWYYPTVQEISKFDSQRKVLFLFEPRGYFCLPNCDADEILDQWKHDLVLYEDASYVLASWKEKGYTDVLFNRFGADFVKASDTRYQPEDWEKLEELFDGLPSPVNFGEAYYLYSLTP